MIDRVKILIVDDHQIFLDGLQAILKNERDIEVVAEARSGNNALTLLKEHRIDIVVMDVEMDDKDGIETATEIRMTYPHIKILMLTMHDRGEIIDKLISIPVEGFILKYKGAEQLVEAIRKLSSGRTHIGHEITEELIRYRRGKSKNEDVKLTPREIEVLRLIASEYTTPEISGLLHIAQSTVETHRRNLIGKLGVKSTLGLVKWAVENGIK